MADTKELLMDQAEKSIRQNGYNAVSFRELADGLGIKSASVHYYFRRKEDLGLALVTRYSDRFFDTVATGHGADASSFEKLSAYCSAYRQALVTSESICLCGMLGAESSSLPEVVSDAVTGFFNRNIDWLRAALPAHLTAAVRHERAGRILASLQGAMMVSNVMGNPDIFDQSAGDILGAFSDSGT